MNNDKSPQQIKNSCQQIGSELAPCYREGLERSKTKYPGLQAAGNVHCRLAKIVCKMADEDNIRRCVRDELELNLVQRTRNLIRSAAVSSARDLEQNLGGGLLSNTRSGRSANSLNDTGSTSFSGTKRSSSAPGHSWRFKKSKAVKIQTIPKTVRLLDKPSDDVEISADADCEDYAITDEMNECLISA